MYSLGLEPPLKSLLYLCLYLYLYLFSNTGIQYPPFHFPPGDALQTFLGCLQAAILPAGL